MSALEDALADVSVGQEEVLRLLEQLREPSKYLVMGLVCADARPLEAAFPRFTFEERGSLSSPYLDHISGADLQLFGSTKQGVTRAEALELLRVCRGLFLTFQGVQLRGLVAADGDAQPKLSRLLPEAFEAALALPGANDGAVVCMGVRRLDGAGGFMLPLYVSLADEEGGETREPPEERMTKICQKLAAGDYAKVLQKVRPLLWGRGRPVKKYLAALVNRRVGKVRFLATQLHMLVGLQGVDKVAYLRDVLCLDDVPADDESLAALAAAAEREMQLQARRIIVTLRHQIAKILDADLAQRFLAATAALYKL
ncbi:hypothetical protein M885DRAFT_499050 [Pelagophyceae sp. CCMP2097]|nr:hypothetical protein M885DRAFT_499050 [Pelagophyceae sp. CCMP2097]